MKSIVTLLLALTITLSFTGCAEKVILVPSVSYYPKFPIEDFKESPKKKITVWVESEDKNGTQVNYLVMDEKEGMNFFKDTKDLRKKYNLLIKKVKDYNKKVDELNTFQKNQKPVEIK